VSDRPHGGAIHDTELCAQSAMSVLGTSGEFDAASFCSLSEVYCWEHVCECFCLAMYQKSEVYCLECVCGCICLAMYQKSSLFNTTVNIPDAKQKRWHLLESCSQYSRTVILKLVEETGAVGVITTVAVSQDYSYV